MGQSMFPFPYPLFGDMSTDLREKSIVVKEAKFIPILFWYDGTHIANRLSYIELVFEGSMPSPVGQFIEDNFSGRVMALHSTTQGRLRQVEQGLLHVRLPA